ncbi:hypothetical protein NE463_20010, partial [Anaerotruncus colihominis]|nr:hypothetical protein [Anaerotruncus colihominis]
MLAAGVRGRFEKCLYPLLPVCGRLGENHPQGPIDASEDEPIPPLADTLLFPDSDPADGFH